MYLYRYSKKCSQCGCEVFEIINELKENSRDGYSRVNCTQNEAKQRLLMDLKITYDYEKMSCQEITKSFPIVLNFMNYNYCSCKCEVLRYKLVDNVLKNCHGKENNMQKFFSQVTLADLNIKTWNFPRAIELLNLALEQINVRTILRHINFDIKPYKCFFLFLSIFIYLLVIYMVLK